MNAQRLLQHYEQIADAPDAIARLRRFIFDLAVRGKLVPQDPADEPALELLRKITKEKVRLLKAGRNGKSKTSLFAPSAEVPFSVPNGWVLTRLGDIILLLSGQHLQPSEYSEVVGAGVPYITGPSDFSPNGLSISRYALVRKAVAQKGQLLLTVKGSGVGKTTICDLSEVAISRQLMSLTPIGWDLRFLEVITHRLAIALQSQARSLIPGIAREDVEDFAFPFPPLREQHRIIAKVDELMALCDELETARTDRETKRDRLAAASLARLNTPDLETFRDDAHFALDALPALTARPDQIKQLRQTILNLAVRGKLVPQDPADEQAAQLLTRLKKQRTALEDAGEIRREKSGRPSHDIVEQGFELPGSWSWARLSELGQTQTGTSPSSSNPDLFGDFIPFIKPADLDGNQINYEGPGLSKIGVAHSRLAAENSILMVCIGATLGKVNTTVRPVCFNQQINSLTPFLDGLTSFVAIALKASSFQSLAWSKAGTGTLPIISKGKWEVLPIPLPPLAEQHRIVAKVDELMALCDQLETSLTSADETRKKLLDALLAEALAPVDNEVLQEAAE